MAEDDFAIAVKRDKRASVPDDWVERVRHTRGVTIVGLASITRLQVRATPEGIGQIREDLEEFLYIERLIEHRRS